MSIVDNVLYAKNENAIQVLIQHYCVVVRTRCAMRDGVLYHVHKSMCTKVYSSVCHGLHHMIIVDSIT